MYLFNPGEQIRGPPNQNNLCRYKKNSGPMQNVLVSFSKRYRKVFDITTGLLLEEGQTLHQLEDIWWNDDDKNDISKNVRKKCLKTV
jgi:hypothetical protein